MHVILPQNTGYVPYSRRNMQHCLEHLFEDTISPGMTFLDLGAGTGDMLIVASEKRLHAYGIEINEEYALQGRKAIAAEKDKGRIPAHITCDIATGSYYLSAYIASREQGKTRAQEWEEDKFYLWYGVDLPIAETFSVKRAQDFFYPITSEQDPYAALGIDFQDIDIFFSYT